MLVNPIDAASLHLSESGSDDSGNNNCQQDSNPCQTWDHASSLLNTHYNRLYISSGFYNAYDRIELSNGSDIKVIGEYGPDTVIYYTNNYGTLFYSNEGYYGTDTSLYLNNITYFPKYGINQRLVYFNYGDSLEMIDVIVKSGNGINSYCSSYNDLVNCFQLHDIIVKNVQIFDMTCSFASSMSYLFELGYANSITFDNILVTRRSTGTTGDSFAYGDNSNHSSKSIQFGLFGDMDGDIYLSNIVLSNYITSNTFYFKDNDYVTTTLTNIILDNVYGGTFFTFFGQTGADVVMDNINVNGNGHGLKHDILDFSGNYYGSFTVRDSIFSNFIFGSFAIGFYFDYVSAHSPDIVISNVTFSSLIAGSNNYAYGLIYVDDAFSISIDNCTFENNTNFGAIVECSQDSYCNVNVTNSIFINNMMQGIECYNNEPIISGFYLPNGAYGSMIITNNVFDLSPIMVFDDTSEIVFDNNEILSSFNDSSIGLIFNCTGSEKRFLYLSNNGTYDQNNDCTDSTNPCTLWSQIQTEITSGDTVFIDKGNYHASSGLDIDLNNGGGILFDVKNYVIIGSGAEKTVIEFSDDSDVLFDFDAQSLKNEFNFDISSLTYYPTHGVQQRFGYFSHVRKINIGDIIVNGIAANVTTYSYYYSYDLIYAYHTDSIVVENVQIEDFIVLSQFFCAMYFTEITIKNVEFMISSASITATDTSFSMFRFTYSNYSDVQIENVLVGDYYLSDGFYIDHIYYSDVYLNNIMVDGVSGDTFFYFYSCSNTAITMNEVTINNSDVDTLMYVSRNDINIVIENSVISNVLLNSNAIGFYLEYVNNYLESRIILNNVNFTNIESTNSYGLIYISDNFDVEINNCLFENNANFISIIHCDSDSQCNVNIKNSYFVNNDGLCLGKTRIKNGILLANNANGRVNISNSVFVEYPYIEYDSTSSVSIDSNTYSMMIGDNDTDVESCNQHQTVFVSADRCVSFGKSILVKFLRT